MENLVETRLSQQITSYLDLAANEAKVTAANVANIDTPGYRAVGFNFEGEMRRAFNDLDSGIESRPLNVKEVGGLISRPDGNDVSLDREGLNLAEVQLKFKTGVALLRGEFQRVMDAIRVDSK